MSMAKLKRYSPLVFLAGTIMSFADPITDILTLVEFYRADHKTWFGVGLAFVILPCLVFAIYYFSLRKEIVSKYGNTRKFLQTILCGFHPFSAAFARLQLLVFSLKEWWPGNKNDSAINEKAHELLWYSDSLVRYESVVESAPQFMLQLYAMSVQEEPVEVIQMISLPVSFLSLVWAFTTTDEYFITAARKIDQLKITQKLPFFTTHLFFLSSRLFAVCFFMVSYKWWVIVVLLFHTFVIATVDTTWYCRNIKDKSPQDYFRPLSHCCLHCWLRDDLSLRASASGTLVSPRMQVLSNVLFVVENFVMILLFYFSQHSTTWYSLPVTVCVCVFSVIGSVMRVILYRVFLKEGSDDTVTTQPNNNSGGKM